jgi:hypothetical protein
VSEKVARDLPDDLVAALRDPSIAVPRDAAVFNLVNTWLAAPSATVSAEIRSDLRSRTSQTGPLTEGGEVSELPIEDSRPDTHEHIAQVRSLLLGQAEELIERGQQVSYLLFEVEIPSGLTEPDVRLLQETVENLLSDLTVPYRFRSTEKSELEQNSLGGFRSTDPETSRKAAIDAFPRTKSQRLKALLFIARQGDKGATYAQVEAETGIHGIWKRLSELKEGGWIEVAREAVIPETGSLGSVYVATSKARQHMRSEGY